MASEIFSCPECNAMLRYAPNLQPGAEVLCPKCQAQFPAPEPEAPPAPSRSRPSEEVTDTPVTRRPRFSEADDGISSSRRPSRNDQGADDYEDEDDVDRQPPGEYSIDINRWFSLAGNHYSSFFGPAIGFIVVAAIISFIPNAIVGAGAQIVAYQLAPNNPTQLLIINMIITQLSAVVLTALLFFPLWSGTTAVCLAQLKGRRWTFGEFFSGFRYWGALAGVGLTSQIVSLLVMVPYGVILPLVVQNHDERLLFLLGPVVLVGLIITLFVQIRFLIFAPSLIFDRNLGAMEAMKANWELTRGHFWGLFGVSFLMGLIGLGGLLACGIGLLFALPYTMLILNAGYLLIAGRREPLDRPYISND